MCGYSGSLGSGPYGVTTQAASNRPRKLSRFSEACHQPRQWAWKWFSSPPHESTNDSGPNDREDDSPSQDTTSNRNPPPSTNSCPCSLHTETGACTGNFCCVKLSDVGTLCYASINLIHKAHGSPHSIHVYCFFLPGLPPHSNGLLQISNRKGPHVGAAKK